MGSTGLVELFNSGIHELKLKSIIVKSNVSHSAHRVESFGCLMGLGVVL